MTATEIKNQFQGKRASTDQSLGAERAKTNQSLENARTKTEERSNSAVAKGRSETDEAVSAAREIADAAIYDGTEDEMQTERNLSDQSIKNERRQIDAVIEKERESKSTLVDELLNKERGETDENLSMERSETDSAVDQVTVRLTAEISGHRLTKGTLTSREEFLGIVSHDLRNPIGAASSCAEMLLNDPDYKTLYPASIRSWLEFIKRNADASLRLISDLLDVERLAQGKLDLKVKSHGMDAILRDATEVHAYGAAAKSILLRTATSKFSGNITCDRDRVLQVLGNLIGNAIKFTTEGGTVVVDAKNTPAGIEISVKDSGQGIAVEKQATIFDRFAQLQSQDRRGLGLGLYITKMLVEAHGGNVRVDSKVGVGSTFFVTIPQTIAQSSTQQH